MKRKPIGDILLEMGAIDELQLQSALAHQRQWGMPLGRAIIEKRFATAEQVLAALGRQALMPVVALAHEALDSKLAALLPRKVAQQHRAVPLRLEGPGHEVLVIAIAAPASLESLDEIKAVTGKKRLQAYLADDASIEWAFGRIYLGYDAAETTRVDPLSHAISLDEEEFDLEVKPRPVLIFGWSEDTGRKMAEVLAAEGVEAKVAGPREVLGCAPDDVIVAPLPAIEALLPVGQRSPGRLVVAGKNPEEDLPRAQLLGARGFLVAPLDSGLLLRSVRRCRALGPPPSRAN